jgi:DNA-binding NarL/FixJ family response regulator
MASSVLLVDDHDSFRTQVRALLSASGYDVVGEVGTGREALRAVRELVPDVLLLDIQLPDMSGFDVAAEIAANPVSPSIVLISSREAADYGSRIARCGARGFISKADLSREALDAVLTEGRS